MTNAARRVFIGTGALTLIAGILTRCAVQSVAISGSPPLANPDRKFIHAETNDVVKWNAPNGEALGILFKAVDFDSHSTSGALKEPPFAGGTPGQDQAMNCARNTCTSPNINPVLVKYLREHPADQFEYKYWQSLNGVAADGRIIIKW
jgi:hypothetical protein